MNLQIKRQKAELSSGRNKQEGAKLVQDVESVSSFFIMGEGGMLSEIDTRLGRKK